MANKEIPTDVQYGYYCIINSRPLTLNEWRNLKQKYPEYFTEEKINELCSINKREQKLQSK